MKKIQIVLTGILLAVITITLHAQKVVPLPEVLKPGMIAVSDTHLYIAEKPKVHVYSLTDFKYVTSFGKAGEGPREFKFGPFGPPMVFTPFSKGILVNSMNKISIFTKDGKFIKEERAPAFAIFTPIKGGYVGVPSKMKERNQFLLTVSLYNSKLEEIKELHPSDITVGPNSKIVTPMSSFAYDVYDDKIFVVIGTEGFVIDVFDLKGNKLHRIKKDYPSIPVTEEYKKKTLHWFKNDSPFKAFFSRLKINFKSDFPAIKDLMVADDTLYVITHQVKEGKREIVLLDLKGKELNKVYLEFPPESPYFSEGYYTIHNKSLYSIAENEDEEQWELRIQEIK